MLDNDAHFQSELIAQRESHIYDEFDQQRLEEILEDKKTKFFLREKQLRWIESQIVEVNERLTNAYEELSSNKDTQKIYEKEYKIPSKMSDILLFCIFDYHSFSIIR